MNKLFKLIERIEDAVLSGVAIPLTPWAVINGETLLPLLDRVRETLPEEIQASHKVLERREAILEEAQQQAATVLEEAHAQCQAILSESELMRAVREEAEAVREQVISELEAMRKKAFEESEAMKRQAYEEATTLKTEAQAYAERILVSLDTQVNELHSQLQNGKKQMHQMRLEHRSLGGKPASAGMDQRAVSPVVPGSSMTHRSARPHDRQKTAQAQAPNPRGRRTLAQQQDMLRDTNLSQSVDTTPPSPYRR
jgi:F0F1-type ATP synthase membrane subunit b/b'